MAVTLHDSGTIQLINTGVPSPMTYTGIVVTAGPNLVLTVHVVIAFPYLTQLAPITASWGGQSMYIAAVDGGGVGQNITSFLCGVTNPTLGAQTFSCAFQAGSPTGIITAATWINASQAGTGVTFYGGAVGTNTSATDTVTTGTIGNGDVAINVGGAGQNYSGSNQTPLTGSPNNGGAIDAYQANYATGLGAAVNFSAALAGSGLWFDAYCGILQASSLTIVNVPAYERIIPYWSEW